MRRRKRVDYSEYTALWWLVSQVYQPDKLIVEIKSVSSIRYLVSYT